MREGRRDPGARGYGWLATFGGAALLLVLGFGVGLLTGSLFEEPDLVARQLSGEAEEHLLPAPADGGLEAPAPAAVPPGPPAAALSADTRTLPPPAGEPPAEPPSDFDPGADDAAAAPAEAPRAEPAKPAAAPALAARPPVPAVPAAPVPAAAPPPRVSAPPPVDSRGPGFAVQVGAFGERAAADQLVGSLRSDRFAAYLVEGAPGEGARFRVRVGPFATREEASGQASTLKARRQLPTWVIREGGP